MGNAARDLANLLLKNVVDTYRKENERSVPPVNQISLFLCKVRFSMLANL